ncbi:MAG TPA: Na+/H+ antiporter [Bryobacteraceae bacterium]
MPIESITVLLVLIGLVAAVTWLARRMHILEPVLLTIAGIVLSFITVFPTIRLDPKIVLLFVLPPLVYQAAVELPWEDFRGNVRPISLFAVGLVLVTSALVAVIAYFMVPSVTWPEALALGAAVAPTDTVASIAVSDRLGLPRRLLALTQGEGLVNDAVALTLLRVAAVAILAHQFSASAAFVRFAAIVVGEPLYGAAIGWLAANIRRKVSDARVEFAVSLLTPFLAFLIPEALGGSGVIAAASAGMYVSLQAPELVSSETRLSLAGTWGTLIFLLEGALFLLTGMQFRSIVHGTPGLRGFHTLATAGAVTAAVIILRVIWTWPAIWLTYRFPGTRKQPKLPNRQVTFLAWCGMRGGISLAAALSLSTEVPDRNLILFITACVIVGTLILQGGSLPFLLRKLELDKDARLERGEARDLEHVARMEAVAGALESLGHRGTEAVPIREEYEHRLSMLQRDETEMQDVGPAGYRKDLLRIRIDALAVERGKILTMHREGRLPERVMRRIEHDLDLREVRLRQLASARD